MRRLQIQMCPYRIINMANVLFLLVTLLGVSCFFSFGSTKEKVNLESKPDLNSGPIIGVLTQELSKGYKERYFGYSSYLAASYVKAVEGSGARVVPVFTNQNLEYYRNIMKYVNGILLPGGSSKNGMGNPYYESLRNVYKIAEQINIEGEVFPVLAVCLGYEFMLCVANDDVNMLKKCNIFYENYPIKFQTPTENSTLFSRLTPQQKDVLENQNSTVNYHVWCAYPEDVTGPKFEDWNITSTTTPKDGKEFIASIEHNKYPFLGVQFHPEKIAYEWTSDSYPHSEEILQANRYFYDQLVFYARKNDHTFLDEDDLNVSLIYNHAPTFTEKSTGFTQMYLFK